MDHIDIQQDYINWYMDKNVCFVQLIYSKRISVVILLDLFQSLSFNICNYPFLFDAMVKTILLQTDQALQMHTAMQNAAASVSIEVEQKYKLLTYLYFSLGSICYV